MIKDELTKEQVKRIASINSVIDCGHWNKGMYDSFILGYNLGKIKDKENLTKHNNDFKKVCSHTESHWEGHHKICGRCGKLLETIVGKYVSKS